MRKLFVIALLTAAALTSIAQTAHPWQPSPGHVQVPIWPGAAPDARHFTGPETLVTSRRALPGL